MILIFGGAYQGKREFAAKNFPDIPVYHEALEEFVWDCCAAGPEEAEAEPAIPREAADLMRQKKAEWQDKVLIIRDVSQGIVPMDARTRAFREMNGRMMLYLASEADEVWRVFCGIGQRIK